MRSGPHVSPTAVHRAVNRLAFPLLALLVSACATAPNPITPPERPADGATAAPAPEMESDAPPAVPTDRTVATVAAAVRATRPPGAAVVQIDDTVAAWWLLPTDGETADSPGSAVPMALFDRDGAVVLGYRDGTAAEARPLATGATVTSATPFRLRPAATTPNGVRILVQSGDTEEELFVVARAGRPLVQRMPVSAVSRTQLEDLDGDGLREMVQATRVFDPSGRREVIVDAYRWETARFVHTGSISLLRELNEHLADFETRLTSDSSERWIAAVSRAAEPIEGSGPIAALLPAEWVTVPRIPELTLDLTEIRWTFAHDVAVEGNLYRLQISLAANPLSSDVVSIAGLEGL